MDWRPVIHPCLQRSFGIITATMILFWYSNYLYMSATLTMLWSSNTPSFYIKYKDRSPRRGETKCDNSESRWVSCPPSHCRDVLQVADVSSDCPAERACRIYVQCHAAANHKNAFSSTALNIQQRFTNPNFPLYVKELYKLFLGFIYLLLIGQRMLLLPFTPSIHVGRSLLSSYTKRSAHAHAFFKEEITLRKVPIKQQQIHITRTVTLQK